MYLYPAAFLASALLCWLFTQLELIPWRKTAGAHWTERARAAYPARIAREMNASLIPIAWAFGGMLWAPERSWLLLAACSYLGALLGCFPMDRLLWPDLNFVNWMRQVSSGVLLQSVSGAVYGLAAAFMPETAGMRMAIVVGAALAAHFALQFGLGLRLARLLGLIRPADERLRALVAETSARLKIPVHRTWVIRSSAANALAYVITGDMAFTKKMLATFSDDEIRAICAHELGHLSEGRWIRTARLLGSLVYFPVIFLRPAIAHRPAGLMFMSLAYFAIRISSLRLSRRMEHRADGVAAAGDSGEHSIYARALERVYEINLMPATLPRARSGTHPGLYDRLVAVGATPAYARPQPPRARSWTGTVCVIGAVIPAVKFFFR